MSTPVRFEHILSESRNGVAHVTLNRPERLNPLGNGPGSMRDEISRALAEAEADGKVGAILISAAGRCFSAGADLSGTMPNESALHAHLFGEQILRFYAGIRALHKPVIAAVHGLCIGAALGMIAQCDLVIAADDARFGLVEGRIGYPGAAELVPLVGAMWAKSLIFTGELIDAERAERIGLVLGVEPRGELLERAFSLAERIARMPRDALMLNKASVEAVWEAMGRSLARIAGRPHENLTIAMSRQAQAPDGRRFDDILKNEGVEGMKRARDAQFSGTWLRRTPREGR